MKKILTLAAMFAALAFSVSCSDNDDPKEENFVDTAYVGTVNVSMSASNTYTCENVTVLVTDFDGEQDDDADIVMQKVKFAEKMPDMDIYIKDVPATYSNGTLILKGTNIVPQLANGTPYEQFTATNLSGKISDFGSSKASFHLSLNFGPYPTSFVGAAEK